MGLIVVDEEQRFGVAQKERLKQMKTSVDVLSLSATPIPRTLNMSLVGLRDLSIIETPPKDRLSIQTVVVRFSKNIIRSAIDLELKREGQVFFLHNTVATIDSVAKKIGQIVPEARVVVAHGGGPACFGMGRMDHGWKVRSEARVNIPKPPSRYQSELYYDFLTSSEASLRFLINAVGADHVVIGSDWPFVGWDPSPGGWLESLTSLSTEEKEKISFRNLEQMLGI